MTNYTILSPNYREEYDRTNLMKTVSDDNYPYTNILDPLDERLLKILKNSFIIDKILWNSTPITTISYKYYETTTLFYVILMYNGFLHEHDIPYGYEIKIPAIDKNLFSSRVRKPILLKGI